MWAKKFTMPLIIFLALGCLFVAYLVGYANGHRAAIRDETKFGLVT